MFSFKTRSSSKPQNEVQFTIKTTKPASATATAIAPQTPYPEKPVMIWGKPTWFLFHTLAFKLKDESFSQTKTEFLNLCFLICRNLPCPFCTEHATHYWENINFAYIQNKQQLKDLFFEFHNMVNKKKGYAIFPKAELDEKYSKANTVNIIQNFVFHFRDKSHVFRNISNDFFRERAIADINKWLTVNLHSFDL